MKLLTELHRRHVPRATVIYVAAAFAVLQAADLVFAWRAAIETGGYESPDALLAFPLPAGVREDPRFERVLGTLRASREELRRRALTS
jgi:hypothetical protein